MEYKIRWFGVTTTKKKLYNLTFFVFKRKKATHMQIQEKKKRRGKVEYIFYYWKVRKKRWEKNVFIGKRNEEDIVHLLVLFCVSTMFLYS